METWTSERYRVQCLLYPWIVFSLLDDPTFPGKGWGRPFPRVGRALVCCVAGRNLAVIKPGWGHAVRWMDLRSEPLPSGSVGFRFRSETEALQFFEQDRLGLRNLCGLHRVGSWVALMRGMIAIKGRMGIKRWQCTSEAELLAKTLFTLRAAVVGVHGLGQLDPFAGELLQQLPEGWIHLHIDGVTAELPSIGIHGGVLHWAPRGQATGGRSVDFQFRSLAIAWKSVANLADNLAAVGKGDIVLRGYIPLADGFNHMLDRLQMYVSSS